MPFDAEANGIPLERAELTSRLRWFILLRWLFGSSMVLLGLLLTQVPLEGVRGPQIAITGVAILCYNWVFWVLERRAERRGVAFHTEHAIQTATTQIALDLAALTFVLNAGGGVENPFFIFYIFHIVIATLLLPARRVFFLAGWAIILFCSLTVAELKGWIPHAELWRLHQLHRDPEFVVVTLLAFSSALVIAVYFGTSIADTLRAREHEVQALEMELAARADELESSNQALREADEVKTQYFRKVSHDLKTPLAAQQSLLRAMLVEMRDKSPESRSRIKRAISRGDELLALLNDLLLLSQTRDPTRHPKLEWLNPVERLHGVLEAYALQAREKGVTWLEETADPVPAIRAEPGMLRTLADNLISNAIKYTPEGGTVTFSMRGQDNALVLSVRDTGVGISPDDLALIGKEFFRTRQARDSGVSGTGLGMTIVRSLVEGMRGRLDIQSSLGEGTAITAWLPVHRDQAGDQDPQSPGAEPPASSAPPESSQPRVSA